jgi:hypothetical protein
MEFVIGALAFAAGLYGGYRVGRRAEHRMVGPFAALKSFLF